MKFKSLGPYCPRHQSWPPVSAKSSEDPSGEKRIKKGGSYRDVLFQSNSCPSSLKTSKLFGIIMQQPSTASDNDEIHHKPKTLKLMLKDWCCLLSAISAILLHVPPSQRTPDVD